MKDFRFNVAKANGELVPFSEKKLRRSLSLSGASKTQVDRVIELMQPEFVDCVHTRTIYNHAFKYLKQISKPLAARYNLKRAIMQLGPSGFPFENFVAKLLEADGYEVQVGVIMEGKCVKHEIDVVGIKGDKMILVECKFHNQSGHKNDVKIPLYIHSRFRDVRAKLVEDNHYPKIKHFQSWIFSNTRFTKDAISYAACSDMKVVGWDFPEKDSLKNRVDQSGLHPLSCLTTIPKSIKTQLFDNDLVLCRQLLEQKGLLKEIGLSEVRVKRLFNEIENLII